MIEPTLFHWLILSTALFCIGLYGLLTSQSAIRIMIAVEIMLNSVAINLVCFNQFLFPDTVDGQLLSLFVIAVAAAEVVLAMAIFVSVMGHRKSLDMDQLETMKG